LKAAVEKGQTMLTAEQYRAKAAEYDGLLGAARSPAEATEYRHLKQSYASLAGNLDWLVANAGKTVNSAARAPTGTSHSKHREGYSVSHKFSVGQAVDLTPRVLRAAAPGRYEICRLMPVSDRDAGDPSYRIKSIGEKHERVVSESDLTLPARSSAVFT
jgi:hypothetical protein